LALLVGALLAGLLGSGTAGARTFQVTYDWSDVRYGFAGWRPDNTPPGGVAGGPWYQATMVPGQGLEIVPTGGGGQPYVQQTLPPWCQVGGAWIGGREGCRTAATG